MNGKRTAVPQMGLLEFMVEDLLCRLGVNFETPPTSTQRTLTLGVKHAPEMVCLPLKITLGNFIEALEDGVERIVMAGGRGPCRFGYYAQVQEHILKELGYSFEMVVIEPPGLSIVKFIQAFKHMAPHMSIRRIWKEMNVSFFKGSVIDEIERESLRTRCYELNKGDTTRVKKVAIEIVRKAQTTEEIRELREKALAIFKDIPVDRSRDVLKIGLVGEFFMLLEPYVNFDIEEYLGNRGVYVERGVYVSDWVNPATKNRISGSTVAEVKKAAEPYIAHFVGGDGQASVGHSVLYAKEGFDGVIQLMPFTCMPEIIAKSVMQKVSKDYDIPMLHFVIDEQTGKAGIITRLEAFIDLLESKHEQKQIKKEWSS